MVKEVIGVRGHPTYGSSGGGGCSEHHSLTGIKGPDYEKRKEQNTVLYECTRILLPELSIICIAIKTILKSYGLVVDVQTASERRRVFFTSRCTFYD